jgi:hypothetical protein
MYKGRTEEIETFMRVHELRALEATESFRTTTENCLSPHTKVE